MSRFLLIFGIIASTSLFAQQKNYLLSLKEHRQEVNKEFGDTSTSILPNKMVFEFEGLNYFEPDKDYNVVAQFKKKIGNEFFMTTSSGKKKKFRQYGILSFEIKGKRLKLPIYQNIKLMKNEKYKDYIFIPFTDLTNGEETYGGGRYIEASLPTRNTYNLDFNYCFNPYCHYTSGYNCPIPPKDNFLNIRIEAGEKVFTPKH